MQVFVFLAGVWSERGFHQVRLARASGTDLEAHVRMAPLPVEEQSFQLARTPVGERADDAGLDLVSVTRRDAVSSPPKHGQKFRNELGFAELDAHRPRG